MATSNRERIRRALELLGESLDTFITGATRDKIPAGQSWTMLLAAKDAGKGAGGDKKYNPRGFDFIEADPASQARALADVDLGILNGNYFLDAGFTLKDALIVEPLEGNIYANFLTVRAADKNDPRLLKLDELLTSPETKAFIEKTWPGGDVSPAF